MSLMEIIFFNRTFQEVHNYLYLCPQMTVGIKFAVTKKKL